VYSAERFLVDLIRLRHREGADVAWDALRRWLRRRGSKPAGLLKMAVHFHGVERAVRHALEIVRTERPTDELIQLRWKASSSD
jgi:hypothetical protein